MNILVVDDEQEIADLIEFYLQNENYTVFKFYSAIEALDCVETTPIDLAILDIMMPELDGFAVCKIIRERHTFPVIMVTAKIEAIDKITGLAVGADDYITKPFNPLELVARVKAQLRRATKYSGTAQAETGDIFDFRGLTICKSTHKCSLFEQNLALTPIEFSILWCLCKNQGKVVSSETLFEEVWGEKYLSANNTVMVHIRRLREKMHESPKNPKFIKTVWGVGYTIESE